MMEYTSQQHDSGTTCMIGCAASVISIEQETLVKRNALVDITAEYSSSNSIHSFNECLAPNFHFAVLARDLRPKISMHLKTAAADFTPREGQTAWPTESSATFVHVHAKVIQQPTAPGHCEGFDLEIFGDQIEDKPQLWQSTAMAEKPVIAFLGPKASYTHSAALSAFPEEQYSLQPQTSIEDVFTSVQNGSASAGVVPFENSSNGSVIFTLDLFADRDGKHPDIHITGEVYVSVKHCLLGHIPPSQDPNQTDSGNPLSSSSPEEKWKQPWRRSITSTPSTSGTVTPTPSFPSPGKSRTKPTHDLSHVQKLYSHPQAWGQCKNFLNTYLKGIERQDVSSTSKAAEIVAQDVSRTSAAISSAIAAKFNALAFLAKGIEDVEGNSTRFFVLRNKHALERQRQQLQQQQAGHLSSAGAAAPPSCYKSLVLFTVDHKRYGSFADALAVFKGFGLNLTSCNSRPVGGGKNGEEEMWRYVFFVEFEFEGGADREGDVGKALEELGKYTKGLRLVGTWESQLKEGEEKEEEKEEEVVWICQLVLEVWIPSEQEGIGHDEISCTWDVHSHININTPSLYKRIRAVDVPFSLFRAGPFLIGTDASPSLESFHFHPISIEGGRAHQREVSTRGEEYTYALTAIMHRGLAVIQPAGGFSGSLNAISSRRDRAIFGSSSLHSLMYGNLRVEWLIFIAKHVETAGMIVKGGNASISSSSPNSVAERFYWSAKRFSQPECALQRSPKPQSVSIPSRSHAVTHGTAFACEPLDLMLCATLLGTDEAQYLCSLSIPFTRAPKALIVLWSHSFCKW
ncbi:uncharacterized protein MYCFIDRAFT_208123 [Pseudocercospora fijiensis CIRAD86]|uniref:prephenate dehydratase n=1 Tax=Pseudocercospora fijiensis (strain CIRAD86) TaxID=383855 RepID=M2ZTY0_PSEFD|nr:uncharacterized protein MYCFIDRAFT_208123 [Pseudocercospora fijiensis CIRAD86]EME82459.1 hypothetical protein MYCFIDRAFT_208123 [Pseudocercospora fijiensis CIRAD86]